MSEAAHNFDHDYWQPPRTAAPAVEERAAIQPRPLACPECDSEFVVGARFCHVCGAEREVGGRSRGIPEWLHWSRIRETVGLPLSSLICIGLAIACVIAAVVTGLIYTATTVLDWQAVQIWRIEWLLAATVALLAGVLLKK